MSWNIPYPNLRLNSKIFALLSTRFSCLKIDHLIKLIGIIRNFHHLDHVFFDLNDFHLITRNR
ncbi:hypothetical protein FX995_04825 [Pseudoalteromonas flavipulchra]|nr:hypothetical protein [Pseudoalteromonas flavipulchra]